MNYSIMLLGLQNMTFGSGRLLARGPESTGAPRELRAHGGPWLRRTGPPALSFSNKCISESF